LAAPAAVFARELDGHYLAGVLAQEETFANAWAPVLGGHRGYNLVFHRGLLYALDQALGDVQPRDLSEEQLRQLQDERRCFIAPTLAQVKQCVEEHFYDQTEARLRDLPLLHANLNDARTRVGTLEGEFDTACGDLRRVEEDLAWLRSLIRLAQRLHPAWRRFRALFRPLRRQRSEERMGDTARKRAA
jgi:hypothetical protein